MSFESQRFDLLLLADMIAPNSRVLDIGCGDGRLLKLLTKNKNIDARGLELDQTGVNACVADGLSVMQGNADVDLAYYPDNAFDYVILSKTIQATQRPDLVLKEMLRIGKHAIVSFPNFGQWRVISSLAFKSQMPVTKNLEYTWYETPNVHFCTITDFRILCHDLDIKILDTVILNKRGQKLKLPAWMGMNNLFGDQAIFLLSKK
ncbi:MAG: methionine biosynthesis protein MetW [Rhizobiales bacterium]|nr:methionine biosynthesis protein MetW [Hyphomicrobiales bacterium]NRB14705.1 methionine biosynthesis protein MetW [Hyphomicrobiales bacterium]